ncbi:MAG TPA: twin-arginine translocation signal domain-containing protein [Propionibacteriaceae bacterium]|nr:twin-arginine translocation signal domain-containing protein [Propionibacteriaceae bacterium]
MSDFRLSTRRTFLAGVLGTAGLLAAGWSGWPMPA